MKKTLLTMVCGLLTCSAAVAQVNEQYEGVNFSQMSPDGRWLVDNAQGSIIIFNRNTGEQFTSNDNVTIGLGKSVTNNGEIVASLGDDPVVWSNGTFTTLPKPMGAGTGMNAANAITPDGSRIVGFLGIDGADMEGNNLMLVPALWTKQTDGTYTCTILPHPEKDFSGRYGQYASAIDISADGKTVVGQFVDFSGAYVMPVVYTEAADGTWDYKFVGTDCMMDADAVAALPEPPVEPEAVNAADYMTEAEQQAYAEALAAYQEQVDLASQGVIDWSDVPEKPSEAAFITDEAKQAAYEEAAAAYEEAMNDYYEADWAFYDAIEAAMTGNNYTFNVGMVTADGKKMGVSFESIDESSLDAWFPEMNTTPAYFDLTAAEPTMNKSDDTDKLLTALTNDGTMVACSPVSEYNRSAFVVKAGQTKSVPFADYLASLGATSAVEFLNTNYVFDVTTTGYDDDWNEITTTVPDSMVTGTVFANPEGTIFCSFMADTFSENGPENGTYVYRSYVLDLNKDAQASIGQVATDDEQLTVLRREYFNLQGQRVAAPTSGVYLEKVYTTKGVRTEKKLK